MDNNNERKKIYPELINYATQGMGENAQFSIAIAVGIFGMKSGLTMTLGRLLKRTNLLIG
jgi:ACR3 family arsenite efflux pump ArsB